MAIHDPLMERHDDTSQLAVASAVPSKKRRVPIEEHRGSIPEGTL